jgi:hypothetical protein
MKSEHFQSTKQFAEACREYVALLHAMNKISSAQSMLRAEQKRTGERISASMVKRGKKEHLCSDLTRLEIKTSARRSPVKKDYVLAEIAARFGAQRSEEIWRGIESRRPVVESEKLAFEADDNEDGEDDGFDF